MKKTAMVALCTVAGMMAPLGASMAFPAAAYASQPTVKFGDSGSAVVQLQKDLNAKGFSCGTPDGQFGNGTLNAVKGFQKAHHLTADGVVGSSTWAALGETGASSGSSSSGSATSSGPSTKRTLSQKQIYFNGKLVSSPMSFADQGTAYMPIYYVQTMLKTIGIQSQWDGVHWNLQVPSSIKTDMSNVDVGTGSLQIDINGVLVKKVGGIAYPDPASNVMTTYMPVWYLMGVLDRLDIHRTWDGTSWNMTTNTSYAAYSKAGTLIGQFTVQDQAQAALANSPGGTVKDSFGTVLFTEPDFAMYTSPTGTPQEFTTQTAAIAAVGGNANAFVVDLGSKKVIQYPTTYYFVGSNGSWQNSQSGTVGSSAPSFAQPGSKYISLSDGNGGQLFYLIAQSDGIYSGQLAGSNQNLFRTVDLRFPTPSSVTAATIDNYFQSQNSPLQGLGSSFLLAQNTYGVDATYLLSHAIWETGWGTSSIYKAKNNLFGYGAYDSNPANAAGNFPSSQYAVLYEAYIVRENYLEASGPYYYQAPTLNGMNHYYATDQNWSNGIASLMSQFVSSTNGSAYDYKQSAPGQVAPIPMVNQEPVFEMNGATGTAEANPYGNLPVFSDAWTGADRMFPGTMQNGSSGRGVQLMQRVVGVTADGGFGPMTQAALQSWQQSHGLPATGVCDIQTWKAMFPVTSGSIPVGTPINIDSMEQAMVGNNVTEWYHVSGGGVSGWVDSQYVAFTNVYRVQPSSGYTANIYPTASHTGSSAYSMHSGDYVVCNHTASSGGFIQVQYNNNNGQPMTGYIDASAVQLDPVPAPTPYAGS